MMRLKYFSKIDTLILKCVLCRFQLVPRTQEGQIFPPLMSVTYTDVPVTDINTQTVSVSTFTHLFVAH